MKTFNYSWNEIRVCKDRAWNPDFLTVGDCRFSYSDEWEVVKSIFHCTIIMECSITSLYKRCQCSGMSIAERNRFRAYDDPTGFLEQEFPIYLACLLILQPLYSSEDGRGFEGHASTLCVSQRNKCDCLVLFNNWLIWIACVPLTSLTWKCW